MRFSIDTKFARVKAWLYAMFQEHNFINLFRYNFHKISDGVYRSSQPTMYQLERDVKKYGIKTILNLKGANPNSAYYLFEKEKCEELGVKLVDITVFSRRIPDSKTLVEAKEIFGKIEYPMWMHCKAGADRTGVYATLFQYFHEKKPIEETNQLRFWPFGHIKYAKAGKIDFYFEKFKEYQKEHPEADLLYWAENIADTEALDREFKPLKIADVLYDYVLRRQ